MSVERRYGVFLRPDPATCWAVTQMTTALRRQFGIVSAGAFPPHATLVGNLALDTDDPRELLDVVGAVLETTTGFEMENAGPVPEGAAMFLDVHGIDGVPNDALCELFERIHAAVLPLSRHVEDHHVTPVRDTGFRGHLSLASHDLTVERPDLGDEVAEFIEVLYPRLGAPPVFDARWCAVYEFTADWTIEWWHDMSWKHLRSWRLRDSSEQEK